MHILPFMLRIDRPLESSCSLAKTSGDCRFAVRIRFGILIAKESSLRTMLENRRCTINLGKSGRCARCRSGVAPKSLKVRISMIRPGSPKCETL